MHAKSVRIRDGLHALSSHVAALSVQSSLAIRPIIMLYRPNAFNVIGKDCTAVLILPDHGQTLGVHNILTTRVCATHTEWVSF